MTFSIFAKIQDGRQKWEMCKFFRGAREVVLSTLGVQNLPEIAQSPTVFEKKKHFPFLPKFKMAAKIQEKSKFFKGPRGVVLRTL